MPITNLDRDYGVSPSIVRMTTTDNLSTVTAAGYMLSQADAIQDINGGAFEFSPTDLICIYYAGGGIAFFQLNASGDIIPAPDISVTILGTANEIVVTESFPDYTISISPSLIVPVGATASSPVSANSVATKAYVDAVADASGLTCYAASTANLAGYTYSNGAAGIGATLTAGSNAIFVLDSVDVPVNQPILYKNDTTGSGAYNGIYIVTQVGSVSTPAILTRASYYDTPSLINNSSVVAIQQGTVNAGTGWVNTSIVVSVGVTPIVFVPFGLPAGVLPPSLGGTGENNGTNTISVTGNVLVSGGFATTLTTTGITSLVLPTAGTLAVQAQVQKSAFNFATTAGSADAYTVTLSPAPSSYTDGLPISFLASFSNTTSTPTINANGLGAITMVTSGGALQVGDITLHNVYYGIYNSANNNVTILNPTYFYAASSLVQDNFYTVADDTGTANAYVASVVPQYGVIPTVGAFYWVLIAHNNTGASTLALNGGSAHAIVNLGHSALAGGELLAGNWAQFVWDGTSYQLQNSANENINLPLSLAQGGTNASLTASNGGIFYSTASAAAILAGTATANLPLLSGTSTSPTWGSYTLVLGGALTTAGALTTSGAYGVTFTFSNTTSVTFPTSGTLATTGQLGIIQLDGDTGVAQGTTVSLLAAATAGSTVSFVGSSATVALKVSDSNRNTLVGGSAGNSSQTAGHCTAFGYYALHALTSGSYLVAIGDSAGFSITSATHSVGIGFESLFNTLTDNYNNGIGSYTLNLINGGSGNNVLGYGGFTLLTTGSYNAGLGNSAGSNYTGAESNNILINNLGVLGESHVLRIGAGTGSSQQQLSKAFISGINGVTNTSALITTINSSTDQLGVVASANNGVLITSNSGIPSLLANSGTPGYVLTANSGAPPSWQATGESLAITQIDCDTGDAVPTAGILYLTGGTSGLTTSGTASTVQITGVLNGAHGGTGINNSGLTINLGSATTGYVLTSDSSGNATWASSGITAAVLLSPSGNQNILNGHNLTLDVAGGNIQALNGNVIAGSPGHAAQLECYPSSSNSGVLALAATVNGAGNFNTSITNSNSVAQSQLITIPDGGTSGSNFIISNSASGQFIGSGYLQVNAGNIYIGQGHDLVLYPPTSGPKGYMTFSCLDNSVGNFVTNVLNDPTLAQTQALTIPDCGTTVGKFILSSAAVAPQTISGGLTISTGQLVASVGNVQAGSSANAGIFISYPAVAASGVLSLHATTNASGNFSTVITNAAAVAQSQVISIPDSSNATADFVLNEGSTQMGAGSFLAFDVASGTASGSGPFTITQNHQAGIVTTPSTTVGIAGTITIVITNPFVDANSIVIVNAGNNGGASGLVTNAQNSSGQCAVSLTNLSGSILTQAFQVFYIVLSQ